MNHWCDSADLDGLGEGLFTAEINDNSEEAGFVVSYQGIREGKSFTKIKFTVIKMAEREERDLFLQGKAERSRRFTRKTLSAEGSPYNPQDHVLEKMLTLAPGWDRQALVARFNEWKKTRASPTTRTAP